MNRNLRLLVFFIVLSTQLTILYGQAPPPTQKPPYEIIKPKLVKIDSILDSTWNHVNYCTTIFGAELYTASSNRGPALLDPGTMDDVIANIVALDSIGVKGVSIIINYPILVSTFPQSLEYLSFYQQVANEVRQRGLKLMISCEAYFPDTIVNKLDASAFCLNINSQRYESEKTQMLQTIIDSLQPDYLTIENEPTTMLKSMGLDYSVDSVAYYVNYFTDNIDKKLTKLGSGAGTWEDMDYFRSIVNILSLDYIDMHIAQIYNNSFIKNAVTVDSLAKDNGKTTIIGNSWLYKIANTGYDSINTYDNIISRNIFDTYITVDSLFTTSIFKLSNMLQTEFTSYNSTFLFKYIHDDAANELLTPYERFDIAYSSSTDALNNGELSLTGQTLKTLLHLSCYTESVSQISSQRPYADIYPNPTKDKLNINLELPYSENVIVKIVDLYGNTIINLNKSNLNKGSNKITLDAKILNEGIYILRIESSDFTITKRFVSVF